MAVVRARFRRSPVAATAVALGAVWIVLNVYETAVHWHRFQVLGWYEALTQTISFIAFGLLALAGMVWLVDRVFADRRG